MSKNSTATATVIPFHFEAKQVRTLLIADEPWFAAKDIVSVLGYAASSAPAKLVEHVPAQWKGVNPIHTPGGAQKLLMLSEQGLYFFLGRSDKQKALPFQMWLAGEVLPAIRKHGQYVDGSSKMATLVNDVIGMSGANLIGGVISQKVSVLPAGVQRQAKHKLHAILHTRFNVPRTELIPADKLDTACQYIGAYTLEGDWMQKPEKDGVFMCGDDLYRVWFLARHFDHIYRIFRERDMYRSLTALGSRAGIEMIDHFKDGSMASFMLLKTYGDEMDAYQRRNRMNQYHEQVA